MIEIKEKIEATVRYEVLRNGAVVTYIYADGTPTVTADSTSALKMSLSGSFHDYSADAHNINFLSDRLRPVINLNGTEYKCGRYCITNPVEQKSKGVTTYQLTGYSLLYLLQQKKIETRLSFAAGSLYTTALASVLIAAGITDYQIDASSLTFASAREDWEIGTDYLTIINALLSEMAYNTAYCDNDGKIICSKYTVPALANIKFTYKADKFSIIGPDYSRENDWHSKANVFMVICSNPDLAAPLIATSENTAAGCKFNIASIGRILNVTTVDNIASQSALQAKADELKMKSLISTERVSFYTAINPEHSIFNTVALDNDKLNGIFAETGWTMPLSADGKMTHTARRALYE